MSGSYLNMLQWFSVFYFFLWSCYYWQKYSTYGVRCCDRDRCSLQKTAWWWMNVTDTCSGLSMAAFMWGKRFISCYYWLFSLSVASVFLGVCYTASRVTWSMQDSSVIHLEIPVFFSELSVCFYLLRCCIYIYIFMTIRHQTLSTHQSKIWECETESSDLLAVNLYQDFFFFFFC